MPTITFDSLRWLKQPARVTITLNGGPPKVYFQITAPRETAAMCLGRPVEELPRILAVLSPAHHLCAAQALDRLFGVEPPEPARNMREGLRQALFFRHHLRKFSFLLTAGENPLMDFYSPEARRGTRLIPHHCVDDLQRHVSLAQEAAAILGGRADHPLTAVAGGVSHFLKEEHCARLTEIAVTCRDYALRLSEFLGEVVWGEGQLLAELQGLALTPLASLALGPEPDSVVLLYGGGQEATNFPSAALFEKVGLHWESWTYEPFAFLKDKGWQDLTAAADSLFFVGPLARLNQDAPLATTLAEAERQRLIAALGPFPHFGLPAAYWALLVELLAAAEQMVDLYQMEKLEGPAVRTVPTALGSEGHAALEGPKGLIYHHFQTDDRGLVREIEVLDPATENNGLFELLSQKAVEASLAQKQPWEEIKKRIELSLLSF
jgi:F420-non-reducing hydrogenase large subunit